MELDDGWTDLVNEIALINNRIGRLADIRASIDKEGAAHVEARSQADGSNVIITVPAIEIASPDGQTALLTPQSFDLARLAGSTLLGLITPDGVLHLWHSDGSVWSSIERVGYSDLWGIAVQGDDGFFYEWAEGAPMFVGLL